MATFLLDSDVNILVAPLLVTAGHDAMTTRDFRLVNAADHLVFARGAETGRIIVTHNVDDFRLLHLAWRDWPMRWGQPNPPPNHAGVIAIPHHPDPARTAAAILAIQASHEPWDNRAVCWNHRSRAYDVHVYR